MTTNSLIHVHTFKALGSSAGKFPMPSQYCPNKPSKKLVRVTASASDTIDDLSSSSIGKNLLTLVLEAPGTFWKRTSQPMRDFGFGRRSLWEGGVGLFVVSGMALFALTLAWLNGFQLRSRFRKYHAVFEFSQACGICVGTPVRIRGVTVGNVVRVDSSLKCVEAVAEVSFLEGTTGCFALCRFF